LATSPLSISGQQVLYPVIALHHLLELLLAPPTRYPDIYPVTNVLISCSVFVLLWMWAHGRLMEEVWGIGGFGSWGGAGGVAKATIDMDKKKLRDKDKLKVM
jgi:alpha-1,3-glucosyltransferase